MKKLLLLTVYLTLSTSVFSNTMKDLGISSQLMMMAEYGSKSSWSYSELNEIESLVNELNNEDIKQVWISNIITYALVSNLPNQPPSTHCKVAEKNIARLKDNDIRSIWKMNFSLYGC